MVDQTWEKGVELELHGIGKYRMVRSTEDAAQCLVNHWPVDDGKAYMAAQRRCLAALQDRLSTRKRNAARKAFIDAADEAAIFIRQK